MNTAVVENTQNKHMKNSPLNLGVISAPNSHYKPVLYSHVEASKEFNKLNEDIYINSKHSKPLDRKKTPTPVFYTIGAIAMFGFWKLAKHLFKK